MSNVERLAQALGVDPDTVPEEKKQAINKLSREEVDKIIELGSKIAHKDDPYGPFPV
ncbi:MAG: hypothetical protein R3192_16360 [Woeseiaceae bacterium]|nr:hypothetical protein [Woeseiaceae bacterium]